MRDLGLTLEEAQAKVDVLTAEMHDQSDIMKEREEVAGSRAHDKAWLKAERAFLDAASARAKIWDSGIFPWRQYDRGNVLDGEGDAWAARVMCRTYPGLDEPVLEKALKIEVLAKSHLHVLVFTDTALAAQLALSIMDELRRWEDDSPQGTTP